jgi:hypothetical protein
MPYTPDPLAVAIPTFKGFPLSAGDCYIKVTPERLRDVIEVYAQFSDFHEYNQGPVLHGEHRAAAEPFVRDITASCGGVVELYQIKGPIGDRMIAAGTAEAGDLVNPFSGITYSGVYLTGVTSDDGGGRYYKITWTFSKPRTEANDGTTTSSITFNNVAIGNRGGFATISTDGHVTKIAASSQYVWTGVDTPPLTYLQTLANTLNLNASTVQTLPRGGVGNRAAIKTYAGTIAAFAWAGHGSVSGCVLESLNGSESNPGIFEISANFTASR